MNWRRAAGSLFPVALFLVFATAGAEVPVPALNARITDQTGTLTKSQSQALVQRLAAFEQKKGSQIAVLIVPTTKPEAIEQYSIRVVDKWKLGRKGVDDGALLLIAKNDRKLRIEVGYGLEGVLTDVTSKRIISEIIKPRFRKGDFYGGIEAGVERMLKVIDGEPLPPPDKRGASDPNVIENMIVAMIIAFAIGATMLPRKLGRLPGAAANGGITGVIMWLIIGTLGIAIIAGVVSFFFSLAIGSMPPPGSGGWSSHDRYGGYGRGGGGFGGGFGGGGGGFGGGGASGGW